MAHNLFPETHILRVLCTLRYEAQCHARFHRGHVGLSSQQGNCCNRVLDLHMYHLEAASIMRVSPRQGAPLTQMCMEPAMIATTIPHVCTRYLKGGRPMCLTINLNLRRERREDQQ